MSDWTALTTLLDQAPGRYSVCVGTATGVPIYDYAGKVVRSAASLIKVPLALAIYDTLPHRLDEPVTLREGDRVAGEGSFDGAPPGTVRTVRELIGHALRESDNTAANLLIERIGFEAVNHWLVARRLQTRLQRKFMDFDALHAGRDNLTTAADMCVLLLALLQPRYADLLAMLRQAVGTGKLEAGLPPGTFIAHKVGDLPGVEHDAGIIFAANGLYLVAVLAVELQDAAAGRHTIAEVSRLVWERMTGVH